MNDLVNELFASDAASELTNRAARRIATLEAKVAELEGNERAYAKIVGPKSYQEVADEIAALRERLAGYEDAPVVAWGISIYDDLCDVSSRKDELELIFNRRNKAYPDETRTFVEFIVKPAKKGTKL